MASMSGHSHYATIKRQKAANDQAKGRIFSKHAKAIAMAIKAGGGANPEMNSKLRFAIDQAKVDNMPRSNIDRILSRAESVGDLSEVTYEGFGPEGVAIIVQATTDNKNRTSQEIKNIFERGGGSLAGPGSVIYNFEAKGLIVVKKTPEVEKQMLALIDLGVEDVVEVQDGIEVYTSREALNEIRMSIEGKGMEIVSFEQTMLAKNPLKVTVLDKINKIVSLLEALEEQDDVQSVYANLST